MLNINDNGLFKVFPAIETIANELEYQNQMLNKIVLTGKINALNIAENLFNFTEQTAQTFAELQNHLIENLLEENKKELILKAKSKAQVAIDTLNISLYERSADIELLAKDSIIIDFLKAKISKDVIKNRLQEYVDKYSVYSEVIIFDTKGNLKVNINKTNKIRYSKDEVISQALNSDKYIQGYKKTDMFIKERESLFFAKRIEEDGKVLGVVVTFYKFKEEMKKIFDALITEKEIITIVDKYNNVLTSSEKGIDKNFVKAVNKVDTYVISNDRFHVKVKVKPYEGYVIGEWYAITSFSKAKDINLINAFNQENMNAKGLARIHLNNPELKKLADNGYAILEDLSDVIINGELIAAKSKQYILIPILDNLREVSFRVVKLIELSISNLQKIIDESLVNDVKGIAGFIHNALIRNLYERTNDIRWWALMPEFQEFLETKQNNVNKELKFINELYLAYSDIFLYDTTGEIVAISNNNLIGEKIEHNYTTSNKDSNQYFVTPFSKTKLYHNQPTYVFFASIVKDDKIVGGIGAVFDIQTQFSKILYNYMNDKNGYAYVVNSHKEIISSTNDEFSVLETLPFDIELKDGFVTDIDYNNKIYKLAIKGNGEYREYKNKDLYSIVMIEK